MSVPGIGWFLMRVAVRNADTKQTLSYSCKHIHPYNKETGKRYPYENPIAKMLTSANFCFART